MTINPASIPPDGRHRYAMRVYYEDTDAGGVVYHANYLRYAERARTEALRDWGVPHADLVERFGLMFMVRQLEVDYRRGARLDEALTVESEVLEVGGATVRLRQTVRKHDGRNNDRPDKDGVCAVLAVRLACVRLEGNKPGRIPLLWRETLTAMRNNGGADGNI
jgi:acyl-CoA thioester hydrolase